MTRPGPDDGGGRPPEAELVTDLARSLRRRVGRPDAAIRLPTAELRELLTETLGDLAEIQRDVQRRTGRAYVKTPGRIGINQRAIRSVAPVDPRDGERERMLVGGLLCSGRQEVTSKLLRLVDQRYLLDPATAHTWLAARQAFKAGSTVLRPAGLGGVENGIGLNTLRDLQTRHLSLDADELFDNAKESAYVGLDRHAFVTAGYLESLARRADGTDLTWLSTARDAVNTVDAMAGRIEVAADKIDRRAWAGTKQPLSMATRFMHAPAKRAGEPDAAASGAAVGPGAAAAPARRPGSGGRRP